MNKRTKLLVALSALLLLVAALALTAHAKGYNNLYPASDNTQIKKLITAESITMRNDEEALGVSALYSVNTTALEALENDYYVTFGALVARESDGYNQSNVTVTYSKKAGSLTAAKRVSMLTVYSTLGKQKVNATFLDENRNSFSATLDIGTNAVMRSRDGAVHAAFILLEPKEGGKAKIFYVARKGTSYNSLEEKMQLDYQNSKGDEQAVNDYISFLQSQIKADVDLYDKTPVKVCKQDRAVEGEPTIWVQYVPEKDPYPDAKETVKRNVKAAYIYYPIDYDPAREDSADLVEMGVKRVFAYIATPPYAENVPGLVCVHGGGGHAYAQYALEAAMNGYAAIAIDTEGYHNTAIDGAYTGGSGEYIPDPLGHMEKDSFKNADGSLADQWIYNAVMDTVLANTVLRSMDEVNADKVGITGISWGGLITSTAICFDDRYAFASPIYISFHMSESSGISVGGLKNEEKKFAAALWQDTELLKKCQIPTLIISCENDLFASIDTVSMSANDLPNGTLLIKPRLLHGQQYGASLPEIYEFGYKVLEEKDAFITAKEQPTAEMDLRYTLTLDIPEGASDVSATLYYLDRPIFEYSKREDVYYKAVSLTVKEDGTIDVRVPADAYVYFISFSYYDEEVYKRQNGTPYLSSYLHGAEKFEGETNPVEYKQGYIYSSTDIVIFD